MCPVSKTEDIVIKGKNGGNQNAVCFKPHTIKTRDTYFFHISLHYANALSLHTTPQHHQHHHPSPLTPISTADELPLFKSKAVCLMNQVGHVLLSPSAVRERQGQGAGGLVVRVGVEVQQGLTA